LVPIQHKLAWAEAYIHAEYHLDPPSRLATINMGLRFGGSAPFLGRGARSSSNIKSHRPRPTSIRRCILIHAAVWPQQIWAENWGLCLFGERELGPDLTQSGQDEAYLHAKFHLDPSNRLATIHQRYSQDRQTGERSDSIGRTV